MQGASDIDIFWVLLSAFMVFLMQIGFAMVETGTVRAKNTINVAMKNLTDTIFSFIVFWLLGFGLMFGASRWGLVGTDSFAVDGLDFGTTSFFIFQVMFAGTAATIISGAVAERIKFLGYVLITIVTVGLIYPLFGHWAWAEGGWLKAMGFVDFAGSTVVHSVGGWVGLAGAIVLGPRLGKFKNGQPKYFGPSNHNFIVFGVFLLWFAWFGFNAGSLLRFDPEVGTIVLNTLLAGAFGGLGGFVLSALFKERVGVEIFSFGVVSGLVGVTAGCHLFGAWAAALVGFVSSVVMLAADHVLLTRLKVDDPLSVVAIHGCAGAWGTLAVGLLAPAELLAQDRWSQVMVQGLGIGVAFVWAFALGLIAFFAIHRLGVLRVSRKNEVIGLNVAEHNARLPWVETVESILRIMKTGNVSGKVYEERYTEVGAVAKFVNYLLDILRQKQVELKQSNLLLKKEATIDPLTQIHNRRGAMEILGGLDPYATGMAVTVFDIDKFKTVNDTWGHKVGDIVIAEIARIAREKRRDGDLLARWGGEEFVLVLRGTDLAGAQAHAERVRLAIEKFTFPTVGRVTCSFGVGVARSAGVSFDEVFENADKALYQAKEMGRNRVCSW